MLALSSAAISICTGRLVFADKEKRLALALSRRWHVMRILTQQRTIPLRSSQAITTACLPSSDFAQTVSKLMLCFGNMQAGNCVKRRAICPTRLTPRRSTLTVPEGACTAFHSSTLNLINWDAKTYSEIGTVHLSLGNNVDAYKNWCTRRDSNARPLPSEGRGVT